MEFAKLNQRIIIQENSTKTDSVGNHMAQWEEILTLWAMVISQRSTETENAGITKEVRTIKFKVRQCPQLLTLNSTNCRLIFSGQTCNINSVLPDYEHNGYMIISCEIREAGTKDVHAD